MFVDETNLVRQLIHATCEILIKVTAAPISKIESFERNSNFKAEDSVCYGDVDSFLSSGSKWCERLGASLKGGW